MKSSNSLIPRNGHTLVVGIVARISGCQNQKELSLEDQVDHAKEEVSDLYQGECDYRVIATTGKGERLDRPELQDVEALIKSRVLDLLVMEDVGRLVRGSEAVAIWGIAVDHGTRCIAPNDGCDTADVNWEENVMNACAGHVAHCAHTSRRIKHKQMNRFRRAGGALPLTIFGYLKPPGAKLYRDLQKDESATAILRQGLDILRTSGNWSQVADHFNERGVPTGPHCRRRLWDAGSIKRLYRNPILKGRPQRGAKHSVKHHASGRRVTVPNPDGPTYRDEPHLAHFTAEELDAVLTQVETSHAHLGRRRLSEAARAAPGSGKRSRFPGNHARCWYCGRPMLWGSTARGRFLTCAGARQWRCWNSVWLNGDSVTRQIVTRLSAELLTLDGFAEQYRGLVAAAMAETPVLHERQDLERRQRQLETEKANVLNAIRQGLVHQFVTEELARLEGLERELSRRRAELERLQRQRPQLPASVAELRTEFEATFRDLALDSYRMGDLLRLVVPEMHVYLVQLLDGGRPTPRVRVRVDLGGMIRDFRRVPQVAEILSREWTLNMVDPPQREQIRERVVELRRQGVTQREIATLLGVEQSAVQRAIGLQSLMCERGTNNPYELVIVAPTGCTKLRRSLNRRYRFEPLEGYAPRGLIEGS